MKVEIPYGKKRLSLEVPADTVVLSPNYPPPLKDEKAAFMERLRAPLGSAPLAKRVKPTDRVAIVISDMTRATPNERIVPWILEELSFVPRKQFVIVNGTGSHRANTKPELVSMLGREVADTVEIVNHDAFDQSTLAGLGRTAGNIPVWVNKQYLAADFKIVTGFIEPHFFAGFSGGPKGILPGIGGIETIQALHSAALIGHPKSSWAILEDNPLQQAVREAVALCPPDFMVNVTLDREKHITGIYAGHYLEAHKVGCQEVVCTATQPVNKAFDIVVTSNSGYPLDQNLYQSVKGMAAAAQIVRQGGAVLLVSECSDGLPSHGNFKDILKMAKTPQELLQLIQSPGFSRHDQWEAQKQAVVQCKAEVYLHSSLSEETTRQAMLLPAQDLQATFDQLRSKCGSKCRVAVLPEGPLTIPYIK